MGRMPCNVIRATSPNNVHRTVSKQSPPRRPSKKARGGFLKGYYPSFLFLWNLSIEPREREREKGWERWRIRKKDRWNCRSRYFNIIKFRENIGREEERERLEMREIVSWKLSDKVCTLYLFFCWWEKEKNIDLINVHFSRPRNWRYSTGSFST